MKNREELQSKLEEILGSKNVYYQAPSVLKYPCILYSLNKDKSSYANNNHYKFNVSYDVILIDRNILSETYNKLKLLPMCEFDRHYVSDGYNHWAFTICL